MFDQADPASSNIDIWAMDVGDDRPSRLTFDSAVDFYPVCSLTGQDAVFASLRDGPPNLYRVLPKAPGNETRILVAHAEDSDRTGPATAGCSCTRR